MARKARSGPISEGAATDAVGRRLLSAALAIAEEEGWSCVRMGRVAERADVTLAEARRRFPELDDVIDAWFARALDAALAQPVDDGRPAKDRLLVVIGAWLDALAPHRRVTGEMLRGRFWPAHPHHWVPTVFQLSRLVHWLLDAARIETHGPRRQGEEIGLTLLVLATLAVWQRDESPGQARTRAFLARGLEAGGRMLRLVPESRPPAQPPAPESRSASRPAARRSTAGQSPSRSRNT